VRIFKKKENKKIKRKKNGDYWWQTKTKKMFLFRIFVWPPSHKKNLKK